MSDTLSGLLSIAALLLVLALVYVPLGDYMARVYTMPDTVGSSAASTG